MIEGIEARLDVVSIASENDFYALRSAWNAIASEMAPQSVFHRHEWFAAAWAWRKFDAQLHALVARRGNVVAGILPLVRKNRTTSRGIELELLTVPDTQFADMVCAPQHVEEVSKAFAQALFRDKTWDTARLDPLPADGHCCTSLTNALSRQGLSLAELDAGRNFYVDLKGPWNDYYKTRSRSLKKAMNLAGNRLRNAGIIRIEQFGSDTRDVERISSALESTIAISARSWKRATGNSLDQAGPQAFIRTLSHSALERGWLALWLLYIGDNPVAMEYDIVFAGNVHALRADFDADCVEISPGAHLFRVQLEQLFDSGLARYYMGRGENAYKLRWTQQGEPLKRLDVYNRTPRGLVAWLHDRIAKPAFRRVRDAVWQPGRAAERADRGNDDAA